jgi:gamma-glutamyl hercynylcysteine S-oxide synthase
VSATATAIQSSVYLLQRLAEARSRTDELFAIVKPEALYDRPISQRHRIVFYIGHLETFDWNLLGTRFFGLTSFSPAFDQLFAFGIDPVDGGLPTDQPRDWPTLEEVARYSRRLRGSLDASLAAFDESATETSERRRELSQLLNVAIEHRLMHAETLAYMLHQLPIHRKSCAGGAPSLLAAPAVPHMVTIPAGSATLGLRRGPDSSFGWDNEFEQHVVDVGAFRIDAYPVTQGEFLRFVNGGGYQERSRWNVSDWEWLQSSGTTHPAFWAHRDGQWFQRTMFDEITLPLDWPVSVSHAEAAAYSRWAGKELPSEAEWHRAAYGSPEGTERMFPWGDAAPAGSHGNFVFARWDPTPV